ncbi:unnamed protein product [Lactuca virosa]|uniref:Uncharacterized protein n=1 Tax=Lactuca virosa TaxID=75947 RepID=A0AAU9LUC5_9ASTR|nr:unnamed protein product [Lactuca virosa]
MCASFSDFSLDSITAAHSTGPTTTFLHLFSFLESTIDTSLFFKSYRFSYMGNCCAVPSTTDTEFEKKNRKNVSAIQHRPIVC